MIGIIKRRVGKYTQGDSDVILLISTPVAFAAIL